MTFCGCSGSPPESESPAFDAGVVEVGDDTVGHLSGKRHTGVHPPGAFVVAAGALVDAAGDKQGAAGAGAVDDVDGVVLVIIHFHFSINAIAALAALTHPSHVLNVRSRGFLRLPPCSDVNCFAKTKECGHFWRRCARPSYNSGSGSPDKALRAAIRERLLSGQTATGPVPSPRWGEGEGLNQLELTNLPIAQVLHAALHFFLLAGVERPRVRAAEITAHPAGNGNAGGVVVTAFRAGKALAGALELAGKTALVALIDRRIGPVVRHVLIAVIPHVFQRLEVMLDIRVLAVANEPPLASGGYGASKSILSYGLTFFSTSRWKLLV